MVKVFRSRRTLRSSFPDATLAARVASEYLGTPLTSLDVDFLSDPHGLLLASENEEVVLALFFKKSERFSEHLTCLLEDYVLCQKRWADLVEAYPAISFPPPTGLGILVFTPDFPGAWHEITKLISAPIAVITYSCISSNGEEALVLNTDDDENGTQGKVEHSNIRVRKGSEHERRRDERTRSFDTDVRLKDRASDVKIGSDDQEDQAEKMHMDMDQPFFIRAKLARDEIRALLEFERQVENIKQKQ